MPQPQSHRRTNFPCLPSFARRPCQQRIAKSCPLAKLVTKRDGNIRLVECAIPWTEIPDVQAKLKSGERIKFTFRINDNGSPAYELNEQRSVSKADTCALHDYWSTSRAVETEFAFEK